MAKSAVQEAVSDVPSLRGVFITAMPDCLLFDSWTHPEETWSAEDAASYFGDVVRANREGLKSLRAWSAEMQVTIESATVLLVLKELRDFVVTLAFERDLPLGMVRLHTKRVLERLNAILPKLEATERPRGVRVIEFLERYAPDAHAVLQRVSLRTGIAIELLRAPDRLDPEQTGLLEESVKDILGLDTLSI
jgi:hypothetical protein